MIFRKIGWAVALALLVFTGQARASEAGAHALRATLANGLRVVIVPDRLAPVVTTELNYLVGSNDAPGGFPGTAHALEHMMFRGSKGLNKDQLAEIGARLGGDYNADTTETVTQFTYTVPAPDLNIALRIEALRMNRLTLAQRDWETERGAIEQEVSRDLSSPFYRFMRQTQAILFKGTPYEHDALGTRSSFNKTNAALLRRFYEKWYAPNNAILVIAGDVQPDVALAQVRAAFEAIPGHKVPAHRPVALKPLPARTLKLDTNFSAGVVAVAYRMPGLRSGDFAAADILSDVLTSQRGALFALVPEGKALMAQFAYQPMPDVGFGLALAAFPTGRDPSPVLADVRKVLADIARHGVPPALVEAAKRQEIAQLAFRGNSISGLADTWSQALAFQGLRSPSDLAQAYQAVTVAEVDRMARQLLDPAHAVTAILTPHPSGKPVAGKGFGGAEAFGEVPAHPVALPAWAAQVARAPRIMPEDSAPTISTLPNGLTLIVQPEHVSHTISVYGDVRQVPEMQEPPSQDGVARVMRALFGYGTQKHDRLAFQAAVDQIAAQLQAGPFFSLQVLTPEFPRGMQLLAENMLQPAFPDSAFPVVQRQIAQGLAGEMKTPGYAFQRTLLRAILPDGDPGLRHPTPAEVMGLNRSNVLAYYDKTFRPDLTTMVIVGDITPEAARRVVEETFGGWKAEGPKPHIELPPVPPNHATEMRVPDTSAVQDRVVMAETLGVKVTDPDRYRLLLGNAILGSGFSSRLYQDLRVRTGYVYTVSSGIDWARTRADYSVMFGCDPKNVAKARDLVLHDLKAMQTTQVTPDELTREKAGLLRQLPLQQSSVGGIASRFLHLRALGLPIEPPSVVAGRIDAVTAPEIEAAFAKWLRPHDLVTVVKGPSP